jgi:DNA-binding Lrp family transcriptional regulator
MAISAFVLIRTETGRAFAAADAVRAIDEITASDVVTGPYDVIATIHAESLDDLAKAVVAKIQSVDGVIRTYTCPVFNL